MPSVMGTLWSRGGTFVRYAAGSLVAAGCSEVALVAAYAVFGFGARTAAILAWAAGAVPNYVLNRRWAWKQRGPASFLRETLPYWAITLSTAVLAVTATTLADDWVRRAVAGRGEQSLLLGLVYLAAYGFVFALKYFLFDNLVFSKRSSTAQLPVEPAEEPADDLSADLSGELAETPVAAATSAAPSVSAR
jgi:putative flippase GtrA